MRKEDFYKDALTTSQGPLDGLKVLEATTAGAGPWAGTVLADLGAVVIRCEMPGVGDMIRHAGPFVKSQLPLEASTFYLSINRNKKAITLNLKLPEGQDIFRKLAKQVDIVIQNFKPGVMEKWGLGYEDIKKVKSNIIYTSVSGFGQYGPYRPKPAYDRISQAMGGMMSITGDVDGPPTTTGNSISDHMTGWMGALGSIAALYYRDKNGRGQHVDVSLLDSMLYVSEFGIMAAANAGYIWHRMGSRHPAGAPINVFNCRDGYVFIVVASDSHWAKFCKLIKREDLIADPRAKTMADRAKNAEFVEEIVQEWLKEKTVGEVVKTLEEAQLAVGPILSYDQLIANEHVLEREMVVEVEHPAAGRLKLYGVTPKFSLTSTRVRTPAPMLGQHNEEIYGSWLGFDRKELDELKAKGVI